MYIQRSIFLFVLLFGVTSYADASEIRFVVVPSSVPQDTASVVEVRFDPEGDVINALEGVIGVLLPNGSEFSSVVLETGDSLMSLWPVQPSYDSTAGVIRFTGGVPEGVTQEGLLFRIRLFSRTDINLTLSWLGGFAYQGDGFGTPVPVSSRSLSVALRQNEPNLINPASADSRPPRFESVIVSRDPDIFEGKYFVSFNAVDDISGIVRYEVIERQVRTLVTQGVYVLQDQERRSKVVIVAYDQAGNSTSTQVPRAWDSRLVLVSALLLSVLISGMGYFFWRRKGSIRRS